MPRDTIHSQDTTTSLANEYLSNVFCAIFKEKVVIVEDVISTLNQCKQLFVFDFQFG